MTEDVIRAATVGMKEGDSSLSSILNDLFSPLPKRRVKEMGLKEVEEGRYVHRLSSDLDGSGSIDRLALGKNCYRIVGSHSYDFVRLF